MQYRVSHTTVYQYSDPVSLCHNYVHLRLRSSPWQICEESRLMITPEPDVVEAQQDYFGNLVMFFTIQEPHLELSLTANSRVRLKPPAFPALETTCAWERSRDRLRLHHEPDFLDAYQYAFNSHYVPTSAELAEYAAPSFPPGRPIAEAVLDLTQRIHREFTYDPRATTLSTPVHEVLKQRRGVCQDFAHLEIACLRSLGLAARYVSGYLVTSASGPQPRLVGADASHAWLSVFCPEVGWIDFDPTNNQIPGDRHITIAWGRDYEDVSPVRGIILGGGRHTLQVAVDVAPVVVELA